MEAILRIEKKTWRIRLADNETAREFLSRLPFQAEFDVMEHERYCYFEEPFPRNPHGPERIEIGDVMLFMDNCLVVFYDSFDTPYSYTRIGWIENPDGLKQALLKDGRISFLREGR